jgi:hypothetical protein
VPSQYRQAMRIETEANNYLLTQSAATGITASKLCASMAVALGFLSRIMVWK